MTSGDKANAIGYICLAATFIVIFGGLIFGIWNYNYNWIQSQTKIAEACVTNRMQWVPYNTNSGGKCVALTTNTQE